MKHLIRYVSLIAFSAGTAALSGSPSLQVSETSDAITITHGKQTILRYNKGIQKGWDEIDPIYHRSGYIHPVFTPSGQIATGDFSVDHPHQRGIFMAGTRTRFRGETVDFWNLHRKLGRTEHARTVSIGSSNESVSFTVAINHVALTGNADTVVVNEIWEIEAYATEHAYFVFDIRSSQSLATEDPLEFEEYHYGGMALRGSNDWTPIDENPDGTCAFLTSNGHGREDGNHTHTRWVSMNGVVDGVAANITVMCHPGNFRAPQAVRIHPKMPYFTYAPMFDGAFSIQPGETYNSEYRYLVSSSNPDPKWIESQWQAFID